MKHINNEKFEKCLGFSEEELEHIGSCPLCAERMALMAERNLHSIPKGFFENIQGKIRRKKREFLFYSIRVGIATAAAVTLVILNAFPTEEVNFEKTEDVSKHINEFWDNFDLGGFINEKTEK